MTVLDSFRLDGKVVVVTGGNRGLGRAFARARSGRPARPSPSWRAMAPPSRTAVDELNAAGLRAKAFRARRG